MTPLAHRIVKELTLPLSKRTFYDLIGLQKQMDDIHCFEMTEVAEVVDMLAEACRGKGLDIRSTFLPAPKTWIEVVQTGEGGRVGMLLQETKPGWASVHAASDLHFSSSREIGTIRLSGKPDLGCAFMPSDPDPYYDSVLLAALAIINTPRIIGRRQHMPHRGLEKKLIAAQPMVGKFPLHAWTEIKLVVTPPKDMSGEGSTEAHLTGQRALHFCRAHLRIRRGRLEVVRAHWRGDASLGIRRSRYKVLT